MMQTIEQLLNKEKIPIKAKYNNKEVFIIYYVNSKTFNYVLVSENKDGLKLFKVNLNELEEVIYK